MNLPGGIVLRWGLTGQAQEGTAPDAEGPQVLLSARVLGGLPGAAQSPLGGDVKTVFLSRHLVVPHVTRIFK